MAEAEKPNNDRGGDEIAGRLRALAEAVERRDVPAAGVVGTDPLEVRAKKLVDYVLSLEAQGILKDYGSPRRILWDREPSRTPASVSIRDLLGAARKTNSIEGETPRNTLKRILRLMRWEQIGSDITQGPAGAPRSTLHRVAVELFRFQSPYVTTVKLLWEETRPQSIGLSNKLQKVQTLRKRKKFLQTLRRAYTEVTSKSPPRVPGFLSTKYL